jgi:hypothetical protein
MARHARRQEQTAPYAKGRRAWKSVWQAAEEELRRRANDVSQSPSSRGALIPGRRIGRVPPRCERRSPSATSTFRFDGLSAAISSK